MKPVGTLFFLILVAAACNNSSEKDNEVKIAGTDSPTKIVDSANHIQRDSVPQNIQIDSVIHLSFPADSSSVAVKGHLDKSGEPVICYLPVAQGTKLTAFVTPENKKATIRISHIYHPDGKSDGPFGPSVKYALGQKGLYIIYVGHNKMAGDPASTDFILKVKVE